MKKCKQCRSEIDSKAKKCPQCQSDQRGWFARHPILTGLLLLIIISAIASGGNAKKDSATDSNKSAADTTVTPVDTTSFIAEFDQNQLSAETKYKNTLVQFTGVINNISEDIVGTPFLSIKPSSDQYYFGTTIKCSFKNQSDLLNVQNGQTIKLQGKVNSQTLGIIGIDNCGIISE